MKKFFTNILMIGAAVLGLASCDLDLYPRGSIIYHEGEQIITNTNDITAYENAILARFRSLHYGDFILADELMFDGFNATTGYNNHYGTNHRTGSDLVAGDQQTVTTWAYNYYAIKDYNVVIAGVNILEDEDLKKKSQVLQGSAYFFRAWSYMTLARHFAKAYSASASTDLCVPLVTEYNLNDKPERATVQAIYDQIKADLDKAATLLADVKGAVRSQKPTIDAVNAMYARYYLDIKDMGNAAAYAQKVIDTGTYAIASTAAEMKDEYVDDKGKEPIMQMFASKNENYRVANILTQMGSDKNHGHYYQPYYIPSQTLLGKYEDNDLRLQSWFKKDGIILQFEPGNWYEDGQIYVFTKFEGNPALASTEYSGGYTSIKPFKISEMYLIAAEAYLTSNPTKAAELLNELQTKRGSSATLASEDTIQDEWFKETVCEGQRMTCLKRWGIGFSGRATQPGAQGNVMLGANFEQKSLAANDNAFVWPIPVREIQTNPNLVQNPGY